MFNNRFSEMYPFSELPYMSGDTTGTASADQFITVVSLVDIYQAAAARAKYDFEVDKLFNPDYYGDHGSGI